MKVELICDYCHCSDQKDLYMITITGIKNTKDTCSKIICHKCAYHIQTLLDAILDKRDIDETLKEIEVDIIDGTNLKEVTHVLKAKLEDAKATAYAESVDAGMRERRLRRLLWHAIALFCARSCEYFNGIMSHCLMGQDDLYRRCEEKKNKYLNAMYKCRAKADEYK